MRPAAALVALCALRLATAAGAEPPWGSAAARAAASASAGDAPTPFLVLTRGDAAALADICNHSAPFPAASPRFGCRLLLGAACRRLYRTALSGFAGSFRPSALRALHACAPGLLANVELDAPVVRLAAASSPPALPAPLRVPWNLDRLDQRDTPLDGTYAPWMPGVNASDGSGVAIFVIDSGIRGTHAEFAAAGGASRAVPGFDFIANAVPKACSDCDGHGTHVAGTAAGLRTGVAPGAALHCVRVLDCAGNGQLSDVVAALDWVAAQQVRPAVAVLSLGVPRGDWSAALEAAVRGAVRKGGIFVAAAAGNDSGDACAMAPAAVPDAFTVGASDLAPRFRDASATSSFGGSPPDGLYSYGDTGPCLDIFAPGVDVLSACGGANRCANPGDAAYARASGTSMAAPHVAGAAALFLSRRPSARPEEVAAALRAAATPGKLQGKMVAGTPNLLLYARVVPTAASVAAQAGPSAALTAFSPVGGP